MATMAATVAQLEATATDDALELLELLWATELAGKARQDASKETVKRHPRLTRASAVLAVVRFPRAEVRAAVDTVTGMLPPPGALPEPDWRAELARKTPTVVGLCRMLTAAITFGANAQGTPVLAAMTVLGEQLATGAR
jgi:hypothetical protein